MTKMAAICYLQISPTSHLRRLGGINCSSSGRGEKNETPRLLKIAVAGVTELLRNFSSRNERMDSVNSVAKVEPSITCVDDIIDVLRSDYENAYFLTGNFTSSIYSDDCCFEDPTIKFRGTDLYARNLNLLVPFFEHPVLILQQIEKGADSDTKSVVAVWKLRTYLKLLWKPLISIEGSTLYELNGELKIFRHAESWSISALQAIAQIFTPSARKRV